MLGLRSVSTVAMGADMVDEPSRESWWIPLPDCEECRRLDAELEEYYHYNPNIRLNEPDCAFRGWRLDWNYPRQPKLKKELKRHLLLSHPEVAAVLQLLASSSPP